MSILQALARPFIALARLLLRLGIKSVKLTMLGAAGVALVLVLDALLLGKAKAPDELRSPKESDDG